MKSGEDRAAEVGRCLSESGIKHWGAAPFAPFSEHLIPCSGLRRLPQGSRSLLVAVFPYGAGARQSGNLSRYAWGADYHSVVGHMLKMACAALVERFEGCRFEPFCDASPISEVMAACMAGLGVRGMNGLLITPEYGSFVFIGEIVTDLELPFAGREADEWEAAHCAGCGVCVKSCPGGALKDGKMDKDRCVSHLTQKKGELSACERELIARSGSAWGCDICQNVCPMNRGKKSSEFPEFRENLLTELTPGLLEQPDFAQREQNRAFLWRGTEILKRNLRILNGAPADNMTGNH